MITGRLSFMLEEKFLDVYTKFKLFFYQTVFSRFEDREASLTTVETFCMETIYALREPTVNEFANFMHISSPNAAYKVNSLIKKGYVEKIRSQNDRREYHLRPTQKYLDYSDIHHNYIETVIGRLRDRLSLEDQERLEKILTILSDELMPEVTLPRRP
jgi:DNA-binding MarR family transcriptional regulator